MTNLLSLFERILPFHPENRLINIWWEWDVYIAQESTGGLKAKAVMPTTVINKKTIWPDLTNDHVSYANNMEHTEEPVYLYL